MRNPLRLVLPLLVGLFAALAPRAATAQEFTLLEIVNDNGGFDSLAKAVRIAGLTEVLDGDGPLTLYAPTDAAFAALPDEAREVLFDNPEILAGILSYHVRAETQTIAQTPVGLSFVPTVNGASLQLIRTEAGDENPEDDSLFVANRVYVENADVLASNGVFNAVGEVLLAPDVVEVGFYSPVHNTFVGALYEVGIGDDLKEEGPFTVFAPVDDAFDTLYAQDAFGALLAEPDTLRRILRYHVVAGELTAADFEDDSELPTLSGDTLAVDVEDGTVFVDGVPVVIADVLATNGVVHVIGEVLVPAEVRPLPNPETVFDLIADSEIHDTLEAAIAATDLQGDLDDPAETYTVFAPDEDAFGALPEGTLEALLEDTDALTEVLSYHVVRGRFTAADFADGQRLPTLSGDTLTVTVNPNGVFVDDVIVEIPNLLADNGVVHSIGSVLTPTDDDDDDMGGDGSDTTSVFDVIAASEIHDSLEEAIVLAGLDGTLDSLPLTFTVFAPDDDAFAALPQEVRDSLIADPSGFGELLSYHVVRGAVAAADLMDGMRIPTLQGDSLTVTVTPNGVFVDGVLVEVADLMAANGIVHSIGSVLTPEMIVDGDDGSDTTSVFDVIAASEIHDSLEQAIVLAGLDGTLDSLPLTFTVFAPDDEAFAALPQAVRDSLVADPSGFGELLSYHVVVGEYTAADLTDGLRLETLQGNTLTFAVGADGAVFVNDVPVELADLDAANGVVHSIGTVLTPPAIVNAVEPAAAVGIRAYPTVTSGHLRLEIPPGIDVARVSAVDLRGAASALTLVGDRLDLSGLPAGPYVLLFETGGGRFATRVIRTR